MRRGVRNGSGKRGRSGDAGERDGNAEAGAGHGAAADISDSAVGVRG
jgi:hypothetical protein